MDVPWSFTMLTSVRSPPDPCNPTFQFFLLSPKLLEFFAENAGLFLHLQVFPCSIFKVLGHALRALIHFELFLYGKRQRACYSFLTLDIQFFPSAICCKGCPLYNVLGTLCQKSDGCNDQVYFWILYSIPLMFVSGLESVQCYFITWICNVI